MTEREPKSQPTWTDVKAKLAAFDRTALLDLLHHLYVAHKDNQAFLHARFGLGEDVLEPYKKTIDRWLWPDPFRNQAISHYKRLWATPRDSPNCWFSTASKRPDTVRISVTKSMGFSTPWCARSTKPSSRPTRYPPAAATA
jgi:hypothetical protein